VVGPPAYHIFVEIGSFAARVGAGTVKSEDSVHQPTPAQTPLQASHARAPPRRSLETLGPIKTSLPACSLIVSRALLRLSSLPSCSSVAERQRDRDERACVRDREVSSRLLDRVVAGVSFVVAGFGFFFPVVFLLAFFFFIFVCLF